ncbi:MAG: hypothetical protein PVJ82_12470, partial [Desulfobacteraceae bacterium]
MLNAAGRHGDADINEPAWRNVLSLDGRNESRPVHAYKNGAITLSGTRYFSFTGRAWGRAWPT